MRSIVNGLKAPGKLIQHDAEGVQYLALIQPQQFTRDSGGSEFVHRARRIPTWGNGAGRGSCNPRGNIIAQYQRSKKLAAGGVFPFSYRDGGGNSGFGNMSPDGLISDIGSYYSEIERPAAPLSY